MLDRAKAESSGFGLNLGSIFPFDNLYRARQKNSALQFAHAVGHLVESCRDPECKRLAAQALDSY